MLQVYAAYCTLFHYILLYMLYRRYMQIGSKCGYLCASYFLSASKVGLHFVNPYYYLNCHHIPIITTRELKALNSAFHPWKNFSTVHSLLYEFQTLIRLASEILETEIGTDNNFEPPKNTAKRMNGQKPLTQ